MWTRKVLLLRGVLGYRDGLNMCLNCTFLEQIKMVGYQYNILKGIIMNIEWWKLQEFRWNSICAWKMMLVLALNKLDCSSGEVLRQGYDCSKKAGWTVNNQQLWANACSAGVHGWTWAHPISTDRLNTTKSAPPQYYMHSGHSQAPIPNTAIIYIMLPITLVVYAGWGGRGTNLLKRE